jgi:hypothetical protein
VKADGSLAIAPHAFSMLHAALDPVGRHAVPHASARTLYADPSAYFRHASLRI